MRPHLSAKIDGVPRPDFAISRYSNPMKTPPATPEFAHFTSAMRDILKVSPDEMKRRIEAHKKSGKRLSKGSSSLSPRVAAKLRSAV